MHRTADSVVQSGREGPIDGLGALSIRRGLHAHVVTQQGAQRVLDSKGVHITGAGREGESVEGTRVTQEVHLPLIASFGTILHSDSTPAAG